MSSDSVLNGTIAAPFSSLQYPDIAGPLNDADHGSGNKAGRGAELEMTEAEFAVRLVRERAEATAQIEQKLRDEYEQKLQAARDAITTALTQFTEERAAYFARVESEIVQLSLSIAAKILHREAQVDPLLVAALVRMAVERMRDDSTVTVRVHPERVATWKRYFAVDPNMARVAVVEDAQLTDQDCILETELGSANFGLNSQLKEIEQGFFDLLALRPTAK
jgi:flagellar assembly protein FliH